ncbi:MAG: hypothetical protein ACRDL4_21440, partial [Thermoleophilaceae bacterium]
LRELEEQLGTDLGSDVVSQLGGRTDPAVVRRELRRLAKELDEVVLAAVDAAFSPAFAVTGAMAVLAALLLLPGLHRRERTVLLRARRGLRAGALAGAALLGVAVPAAYAVLQTGLKPEPVEIADPCQERERRSVGGVEGAAEGLALDALDRAACRFGSSREELVLALFDEESRSEYEQRHGVDPQSLELLEGIAGL